MTNIFVTDPIIWIIISFAIFVTLAFVLGRKSVTSAIDNKIATIRTQIDAAEKLKFDAETMLAKYKQNLDNAHNNADEIIATAKKQAADILKQGEAKLQETIRIREEILNSRIAQMEQNAVDDIRRYAAELTISATETIINHTITSPVVDTINDKSIASISEKFN